MYKISFQMLSGRQELQRIGMRGIFGIIFIGAGILLLMMIFLYFILLCGRFG